MPYSFKVDHEERKFHFAVLECFKEVTSDNEEVIEGQKGAKGKKATRMKGKLIKEFLEETDEFFTINEVGEMLKLDRRAITNSTLADTLNKREDEKKIKLETYDIEYYSAKDNTVDFSQWEEIRKSNINKLIYVKDLYDFLLKTIRCSYEYYGGYSYLNDKEKGVPEDAFYRSRDYNDQLKKAKNFYCFLKHSHHKSEIEKIALSIVTKRIELHSTASLKDIFNRSSATYERLVKCLDVVRFNFNENNNDKDKDTPRYMFVPTGEDKEADIKKIGKQLEVLSTIIGRNRIVILPTQLNEFESLSEMNFKEPIDYLSVYIKGYTKPPKGYYRAKDGVTYFAIESSQVELEDVEGVVNIKRKIEEEETEREQAGYILQAYSNARDRMRKRKEKKE